MTMGTDAMEMMNAVWSALLPDAMSRLTKICAPSNGYAGTSRLNANSDTFRMIACIAITSTKYSFADSMRGPTNQKPGLNLTMHAHANTIGMCVNGHINDTKIRPLAFCHPSTFPCAASHRETL